MAQKPYIEQGDRDYGRANLALFIAGFVTFSTLYNYQPLLPTLTVEFGLTPTLGSLALSVATFALAWTLPVAGSISEALGRKGLMVAAVFLTSLLTLTTVLPSSFSDLLALRLVQGMILAGVPGVAMAYLSEEMDPRTIGSAMGLYIAGNALGGMTGRIATTWLADFFSWKIAVLCIGALGLCLSLAFVLLLPSSNNFERRPFRPAALTASLFAHLRNPALLCLFTVAFAGMGGFVTLYNYVTFRLLAPPYDLNQSQVAMIFFSYAFGAFGSSFMGSLVRRFSRSTILFAGLAIMTLGLALTLLPSLAAVVVGILIFTVGFFGVHAVASAWVGARASSARAQAASLYLFFYYLGSSVSGTGGGLFWTHWEWGGVAALVLCLILLAAAAGLKLRALEPSASEAQGLFKDFSEAGADSQPGSNSLSVYRKS